MVEQLEIDAEANGETGGEAGGETGQAISEQGLDRLLAAVADPTRRAILAQLRGGPATISQLAEPFDVSFAAVSKHVGVLERAGLLRREVRGRAHYCHLDARPLRRVLDWAGDYVAFWEERLDVLEAHLAGGDRLS